MRKEKYIKIKAIKEKAKEDLNNKKNKELIKKKKDNQEKKRLLDINRKVKEQLKTYQHKMSKRTELMKKLVKIKHNVEKTKPYNVSTKKDVKIENSEDELVDEFVLNNKEIKKMTEDLKKIRRNRKPPLKKDHKNLLKSIKHNYKTNIKFS